MALSKLNWCPLEEQIETQSYTINLQHCAENTKLPFFWGHILNRTVVKFVCLTIQCLAPSELGITVYTKFSPSQTTLSWNADQWLTSTSLFQFTKDDQTRLSLILERDSLFRLIPSGRFLPGSKPRTRTKSAAFHVQITAGMYDLPPSVLIIMKVISNVILIAQNLATFVRDHRFAGG